MKRQVLLSVIGAVVATVLVVAGAMVLLRSGEDGAAQGVSAAPTARGTGTATPATSQRFSAEPRPDCPAGGVGGVALPCLGGDDTGPRPESDVVRVVNLWAWWCEPCRRELPVLEEFAGAHPEYEVVGVHADPDAARGAALLNELGVDMPSYQDDTGRFAGELGLPGVVPITLVFVGEQKVGVFPRTFDSADDLAQAVAGVA